MLNIISNFNVHFDCLVYEIGICNVLIIVSCCFVSDVKYLDFMVAEVGEYLRLGSKERASTRYNYK